ncbi:unnamed protein product [Blepharisma stoltei]|uniref:Calmodulin n=1 Tax=Blepharisma stoltei TaxID=1481888 RepID=A0AAU9IJZ8_9CILI|nr:unnamed protein product [Blepharisma stoltei]
MARRQAPAPKTPKNEPDLSKCPDFSAQDVAEIKEAFDIFDHTGKGTINLFDMIGYLESLKVNEKYPTVYTLIERLQNQFPKGISFKEFVEYIQYSLGDGETGEGLTRMFELLDVEDKKYLDKARFHSIAREIGEHIPDEELEEIITDYYECPNGKVDVDAFYKFMIKSTF